MLPRLQLPRRKRCSKYDAILAYRRHFNSGLTKDQLTLSSGFTWTLATILCKLSILWLYTIIFSTQLFKRIVHGTMVACSCYAVVFIPLFMTHCKPIQASWDPNPVVQATKCRPIYKQELASVAINLVLDMLVVLLPTPMVWKLQISTRKKIFISANFSFGLA